MQDEQRGVGAAVAMPWLGARATWRTPTWGPPRVTGLGEPGGVGFCVGSSPTRHPGLGLHSRGPGLELKKQTLGPSPANWVWSIDVWRPGR